jgi:zinc protease
MSVNTALLPRPVSGPPVAPRLPEADRYTLANGLRVIAAPRQGIPQVVLRVVMAAGGAADPAGRFGTAALVGHLLKEGTLDRGGEALNARIDLLGAALNPSVGHDFAEVEAVLLSDTLAEGVRLLAEVVTRPSFPAAEVERIRAESLDALIARDDEPGNVADDRASREVFGPTHPYGRPSFGDVAGITAVSRDELAAFHAERYRPGGAFLVATGDFEPGLMRALLEEAFGEWSGSAAPVSYPEAPEVPPAAGEVLSVPWPDAAQAEIRLAGRGLERRSPEWAAGAVANYILGGSTITGRLGANLREAKGWTYGAHSGYSSGLVRGGWSAHTAVDAPVAGAAVEEMLGEMRRLMEEPVPAEELQRARDAIVLSLPRAFQTPGQVASRLTTLEAHGLPDDYYQRFTAEVAAVGGEDVARLAASLFHPGRVVGVVVGGSS